MPLLDSSAGDNGRISPILVIGAPGTKLEHPGVMLSGPHGGSPPRRRPHTKAEPDDDAPSRSALRIVECSGSREYLDSSREDPYGTREDSDEEREGSDDGHADSDSEDSDGGREDLDGEREGSDDGREAAEREIDMGPEVETSDSDSGLRLWRRWWRARLRQRPWQWQRG